LDLDTEKYINKNNYETRGIRSYITKNSTWNLQYKKLIMEKHLLELDERLKVLHWVINGLGLTGLKISDSRNMTWDWITIHYNVNDFKCKHLSVSEMGYVIITDGREYDGYCDECNKHVEGTVYKDGRQERWH
jgi:hypothetical protein